MLEQFKHALEHLGLLNLWIEVLIARGEALGGFGVARVGHELIQQVLDSLPIPNPRCNSQASAQALDVLGY